MVADFASQYGVRLLRQSDASMSWHEFLTLLQGLMSVDSRIVRFLRADDATPAPEGGQSEED